MKSYELRINATDYITVEAESREDAIQSAKDIFDINRADYVDVDVLSGDDCPEDCECETCAHKAVEINEEE